MGTFLSGMPERGGMGVHKEATKNNSQVGDIVFFLLYVAISEYGKLLDKGYVCPLYCEVDHKHRYAETQSHIQTTDNLSGCIASEDRGQPKADIRASSYVHRLCGNEKAIRKAK
tara:strand:- start:311 stop:652 length:342 start_codon:yes stop_codon:yes gene_type:complete